ncbi:MAG: glycosyltransferase family 4 protein [Candidatus Eisenbacteria bacterium]|uniref:Glycosyltransferase family 4 protein n=1 Tax=Eiseniibacteriota bacterium TaxID=2212470 RepID=A0A933SFK8_UNCEI|nr:glycosyltransferase family 4 protein [Candidatus Eisenbacteria bacterium]
MIFAYDLRYACDHFAGIGKHAYTVFDEMLALPGDERWHVLWDPRERNTRYDLAPFRAHPRVEWVERPWHPIRPSGAWQVGRWLRRTRPDAYLSPFSLRPLFSGVREVLTLHDVSAMRTSHIPSPLAYALYRGSLLHAIRADAIVTVSEFSRSEILALLPVDPARVHAILEGVPRAEGDPPAPVRPARLRSERFALVVSDNRPRKNLEVLAKAWALPDGAPALDLVGVGPVDERFPALEPRSAAAGRGAIERLGWVSPGELAWLMSHAEVLLLPSLYEGFGFPLVEAMAEGVPALVSDIPVFREVGADAPMFADAHDPRAWAAALARLLAEPAVRERMRERGRARAAELTYRKTAERTLELLRRVAR